MLNTIISRIDFILRSGYLQGDSGLGFAIQEGNADGKEGIYVKTVTPGGLADQVGLLSRKSFANIFIEHIIACTSLTFNLLVLATLLVRID